MTNKIKEGDYVEYVGRPDEKFQVTQEYSDVYNLKIVTNFGDVSFDEDGKYFKDDTHPIVKLTTPPKKKVKKEFEVNIDASSNNDWLTFYNEEIKNIIWESGYTTKATVILEIEE